MTGSDPIAALPMYDWPELQSSNDRFWNAIRSNLADRGIAAPPRLERTLGEAEIWNEPNLVLGQTCGLPFVLGLKDTVSLVGTPAYDIACGAGSYYSVIVVRDDFPVDRLADIGSVRFAFNSAISQSGYAAFGHALRKGGLKPQIVASRLCTGSHRGSIRAVASGDADIASIDAVSWRLAERHEPVAKGLRILASTDPSPGLPFICSPSYRSDRIHNAIVEAMASLEEEVRDSLLLAGFSPARVKDYSIIRTRYDEQQLSALPAC